MKEQYNEVVVTSKVQRKQETELLTDTSYGYEVGDDISLTTFFDELEDFLRLLETDESSKAYVRQKAISLHTNLNEFVIKSEGADLILDADRFLEQTESIDNYDNYHNEERDYD